MHISKEMVDNFNNKKIKNNNSLNFMKHLFEKLEGFCRFINQDLIEEFYKFPEIEDSNQEIEFQ